MTSTTDGASSTTPDFRLSAIVPAHDQDAKDVAWLSETTLATVSRDRSIRIWSADNPASNSATLLHTLADAHSASFINSVTAISGPDAESPQFIASGGADKTITIHEPTHGNLVFTLVGHTDNVCVLSPIPGVPLGLISGSWDKTARVWVGGECTLTLKGHTQAVWGVLALDASTYVTASADRTIKFWAGDKCVHTISAGGHSDVIRGLAHLTTLDLVASASNDGTVRVWTRTGEPVVEMHGHASFVYKVAANPSVGEWVSCGEDRTVRVWVDAECKQTITLPSTTVWSVAVSPSGKDLAACTSDGHLYLFSRTVDRQASAEVVKQYEETLAASAIPQNQIGDINKEKLPGPEALQNPGNRDGQVLMVKVESGNVEAHQWSVAQKKWIKVGDVVDAIGAGRKQVYEGKEYDYVFDIDLGGGPGTMIKLPYNITENPYSAAQNFIWKHELSQEFLDQIAQFIVTNTKGHTVASSEHAAAASQYVDPFTGGNRYTPGGIAPTTAPSAAPTTGATNAAAFNPWTSGYTTGTLSSGSTPSAPRPTGRPAVVPVRDMVLFKQINYAAIATKLASLQSELGITLHPSAQSAVDVEQHPWSIAKAILTHPQWPKAQAFPALDLIRYYVLSHELSDEEAAQVVVWVTEMASAPNASDPVKMLAVRVLVNMYHLVGNRGRVAGQVETLLVLVNEMRASANKNVRVGVATFLLNAAIFMTQTGLHTDVMNVIALLAEMVPSEADPETLYRVVVALGTMASLGATVKPYMNGLGVKAALVALTNKADVEQRTKDAAVDSLALM
ncbi:WD40-repeat-containing domain protein [Catenaria anguillulae PL171]|uniref:WD40-repeat-containing domain protein n=1 Tax=Catenaria anguillulae PL171 TaxID=765915 RepID=A0A1Y2HW97_9FUNG|nr:WD40-repeat-containing domain protein [Catenaria anguillulae PL171]